MSWLNLNFFKHSEHHLAWLTLFFPEKIFVRLIVLISSDGLQSIEIIPRHPWLSKWNLAFTLSFEVVFPHDFYNLKLSIYSRHKMVVNLVERCEFVISSFVLIAPTLHIAASLPWIFVEYLHLAFLHFSKELGIVLFLDRFSYHEEVIKSVPELVVFVTFQVFDRGSSDQAVSSPSSIFSVWDHLIFERVASDSHELSLSCFGNRFKSALRDSGRLYLGSILLLLFSWVLFLKSCK